MTAALPVDNGEVEDYDDSSEEEDHGDPDWTETEESEEFGECLVLYKKGNNNFIKPSNQ